MLTFSNCNVMIGLVINMKVEIVASTSERLAEAMARKNIKQSELSRITGIDKSSISLYVSGKYSPKGDKLYKLSLALGVSPAWLSGFNAPMIENGANEVVPEGFMPLPKTKKVPRLGVISCGDPINSEENFDGYDDVPEHIICDFTLKCEGDSMIGARINDGDLVYIRQQPTIENGQIAAVLIDGTEKLLKRVYINDDSIILQAENPAYSPRVYSKEDMNRVSIIGRAVGFTSILK